MTEQNEQPKRRGGRRPLPPEKRMVQHNLFLRPDQIAWLNAQPNPSQAARDAIDAAIERAKVKK